MLTLNQIKQFFPEKELIFEQNIIREYLQYLILDAIYSSKYGSRMKFIGGTCIRILYGGNRFSEDLDFDNNGISISEFESLADMVKHYLEREGFSVELKIVSKGAFRATVKIPGLLFDYELSTNEKQKTAVFIDTTHQTFESEETTVIINKFGIYREIRTQPIDIILSQKICAFLERKRTKGRDLYDIVFLWSKTQPNFEYLKTSKNKITGSQKLIDVLKDKTLKEDIKKLLADVRPFVPEKSQILEIEMFNKWLEQIEKNVKL